MAEVNIKEKLEEGYIHFRAIIEMLGKPKEHVTETLKTYVAKLSEADGFEIVAEDYSDADEKDGMFSVFAEIEVLAKDISQVAWFSFDYLPSSIEILEPTSLRFRSSDMTNFLNDLLQRLHHLDMSFKTDRAKIQKINANSEALLKNFIGHLVKDESKDADELSRILGIDKEGLEALLNRLVGREFIEKVGDKYSLLAKKADESEE